MHPNYPLHELAKAMAKIVEIADDSDLTFNTKHNEALSVDEIYLSVIFINYKVKKKNSLLSYLELY